MEQCPAVQHQQMEEGGCMHRVAERRPVQVFRILVVAACLLAAAVVIGRQGDVRVGLGEYAEDTENNIFSRRYLSPAQRKYRAMHPPSPPPVKPVALTQAPAPAAPPRPQLPSLIGYSEKEARTFLQEIPGMQEHEMDELVKAASFGHATPLVDPVAAAVAPPPRPLSPAAIAEEHIRAEDVFSRNYGRPVQTTESVAVLRPDPDAELRRDHGQVVDVMREAGKAFAMAEPGGNGKGATHGDTWTRSRLAVPVFGYVPPDRTNLLALARSGPAHLGYKQQILATVPKIDSGLMSHLLEEESQIDSLHIISKAQREDLNPDNAVDVDSELLKKSINSLNSLSPASEGTDIRYGEHKRARRAAGTLNGDEGAADKAHQMAALQRSTQPTDTHRPWVDATPPRGSSTESLTKMLQADSPWNREMAAAVKASDVGVGGRIAIGDASSGDDSGAHRGEEGILRHEQKLMRIEKEENGALLEDASPVWPSAKITQEEEEREAEQQRKLEESERRIALHDEKLRQGTISEKVPVFIVTVYSNLY
jgi:hypothetical protein